MNIEGVEVGSRPFGVMPRNRPCRTVAEIGNAHGGDLGRAIRLIDAAKEAGADFVKFQCYSPAELVALRGDGPAPEPWGSQGWSMRQLYEKARTPFEWFPTLFAHARKRGFVPFSSFFGLESLCVLEKVDCPAYKIAALDNQHRHLFDHAKATGKPVIASFRELQPPQSNVYGLLCPAGYPQSQHFLREQPSFDGFSYHGTDPFVPVIAAARGAHMVECHFQLDDEPSELEANVSLTASQFRQMVKDIRKVEALL